jgi:putative restriction endonuclease
MPPGRGAGSEQDDLLRAACFVALDRLRQRFGEELPISGGLDQGFQFDGRRVPFLNWQKGIFRAGRQAGPAALSLMTSSRSPYDEDQEHEQGFWYAYRRGEKGEGDNEAMRAAMRLHTPLVYFRSFTPGFYTALYPIYIEEDDPHQRRVFFTIGALRLGEAAPLDGVERAYAVRTSRVRLHQGRFRSLVLPAYTGRCAICHLKERRLLDAAHIRADAELDATAAVSNGLSLCTIHHRAYDEDLVGISPDYVVRISEHLLAEDDGPMLDLLKTFDGGRILVPQRPTHRPDRNLLAARFERFVAA